MKIIVSGGGTGGHIYPALTLIRTIQERVPDAQFLYVGTKRGLESDIIPKEGLPFETVDIQGFVRRLTPVNFLRAGKAVGGVLKAMNIVRSFQPDAAVGTGGYVCGPILLAASLLHVPALIQEQNVVPGITNKILSRFVTKIAAGSEAAAKHFPGDKVVFTGNPIRREVLSADRSAGYAAFGLDPSKLTVLISGGSRGARTINRAMIGVLQHYANEPDIQLLHVTGSGEYEDVMQRVKETGLDLAAADNLVVKPYLYNMPQAMAIADFAVFRAGAIGIAELTARGIPSLLVPYPYAAENHQEFNARELEAAGAAKVILNRELTAEKIIGVLDKVLHSDETRARMAMASQLLGRPKAADTIADMILELAKQKNRKR